jgi:hypothetical protein
MDRVGLRDDSVFLSRGFRLSVRLRAGLQSRLPPTLVGALASSPGVSLSLDVSLPMTVSLHGFGDPSSSLASLAVRRPPALDLEVFPFIGAPSPLTWSGAPSAELLLLQSLTGRGGHALSGLLFGMPAWRLS